MEWIRHFGLERVEYPLDYILRPLMLAAFKICLDLGCIRKRHDAVADIILYVVSELRASIRQRHILLLLSCLNLRIELCLCTLNFIKLRQGSQAASDTGQVGVAIVNCGMMSRVGWRECDKSRDI